MKKLYISVLLMLAVATAKAQGPGNALHFTGNNYVSANPFTTELDYITVQMWVYWDGSELGSHQLLFYNGNSSTTGYGLILNATDNYELSVLCGGVAFGESNFKLPVNQWCHIALVRDGGWKLYANGVLYNFGANPVPNPINVGDHGYIGGNMGGTELFNGIIDEFRFFTNVWQPQAILSYHLVPLKGNEEGLQTYYDFNQGVAEGNNTAITTLIDKSPKANHGTLNNFTLNGPGSNFVASTFRTIQGNALSFDGVDDAIILSSSDAWKLRTPNYSIELWINPTTINDQLILYHGWGCWFCPSYTLSIGPEKTCNTPADATGKFTFQVGNVDTEVIQTGTVVAGQWTHVAVTYDGSMLKLYINGKLEGSRAFVQSPYNSPPYGFIGGDAGCGFTRYPFGGKMDEVRVWNKVLTECEINYNMNKTLAGNEEGLQIYYNFDEGVAGATNSNVNNLFDRTTYFKVGGNLINFNLTGNTSNWVVSDFPLDFNDQKIKLTEFSNLTSSSFTAHANITDIGSGNATIRGFAFGDESCLNIFSNKVVENGSFSIGTFSMDITGLNALVNYNVRAFCVNSVDTSYSDMMSIILRHNIDLAADKIIIGRFPYGANEIIGMVISNQGLNAQSNFPVSYTINGYTHSEIYPGTLALGQVDTFYFSAPYDMSVIGLYNIQGSVNLATDENNGNNSTSMILNTRYDNLIIGNGTFINEHLPIDPNYGYTYSQTIYLQSEIGAEGLIDTISYYFHGDGLEYSNKWKIYMGHTQKSSFDSLGDWVSIATMQLVFDGTIANPEGDGWVNIPIESFYYNGTDNLIIAVDENQAYYDDYEDNFYCSSTPEGANRSIYAYEDDYNPAPNNPPLDDSNCSHSYSDKIPNIKIRLSIPYENDLAIKNVSIEEKYKYSNNEPLTVTVKNMGTNPITSFQLSYSVNGGHAIYETFNETLNFNETGTYTFSQGVNLSASGIYEIEVNIVTNDENPANNSKELSVNTSRNHNALAFYGDASYDIYNSIEIENCPLINPTNISLEAWFFKEGTANWEPIVIKNDWDNTSTPQNYNGGYALYLEGNEVFFSIGEYDNTVSEIYNSGEWNHVIGTYDGNVMKLYLNGQEVDSYTYSTGIVENTMNINIGTDNYYNYPFTGMLDEVRIWSVARTEAEILANMHKELDVDNLPAELIAYYTFNQGIPKGNNTSITKVLDATNHILHGTMKGFELDAGNDQSNFVNTRAFLLYKQPTNYYGCYGQTKYIYVDATGSNINYQWQYSEDGIIFNNLIDDADFTGTNNDTLFVQFNAGLANYMYRCQMVDGVFSLTTDTVPTIVSEAITITSVPVNTTICEGESFYFTVEATGSILGYQWYKDNIEIPGATSNSYNILISQGSDAGLYSCMIKGVCGDVFSDESTLNINLNAVFDVQPTSLALELNENAVFTAVVSGTINSMVWQKNGVDLVDGGNISGATTNTLTISNVNYSDNGNYQLVVNGVCNQVSSDIATLSVVTSTSDLSASSLKIIPNPTNGLINISGLEANSNITITDMVGKIQHATKVNNNFYSFDFSAYPNGVYTIKIESKGNVGIRRIIKN